MEGFKGKPLHYYKDVDPWDLIVAYGDGPAFARGNIIKYVARYREGGGVKDLHKALDYLTRLILIEEGVDEWKNGRI